MSEPTMTFDYTWEKDVVLHPQTKPLTLTNRSALPLTFTLRTSSPFSLDTTDHVLPPGEAVVVNISFDAGYKGDKRSMRVENTLVVAYLNHPQRDEVGLIGDIHYPNLDFEYTQVRVERGSSSGGGGDSSHCHNSRLYLSSPWASGQ